MKEKHYFGPVEADGATSLQIASSFGSATRQKNELGNELSSTPYKEKGNLGQGRKSQPRGVPLSQIFTHPGGRGITTNQVVEAPSPPPTCPGSQHFLPWLMRSRAEHGSTRLPFSIPSFFLSSSSETLVGQMADNV